MPLIKEDLPLPLTPVIQTNLPKGSLKSTFLRLWPDAPYISRNLPFPSRLFDGISISFSPVRYGSGQSVSVFQFGNFALKYYLSPCLPAPGPYIDDVVGLFHNVFVMFYDNYGVAGIAQLLKAVDKANIIALM